MFKGASGFAIRLSKAAGVIVFASGCVSAATTASPRFEGTTALGAEQIAVEVTNVGWADVAVYSVTGGARIRLGTVHSNRSARFALPKAHQWATDLRLMVDPVGSARTYTSPPFAPAPGQTVRWTVHETRSFRSLMVW